MSFNVLGVGEMLWDLFPTGPKMGGAPANFAYHAHTLGAAAQIVTRVGDDDLGRRIVQGIHDLGLPANAVQRDEKAPTGTVLVNLSGNGVPQFTIQDNAAWDFLVTTEDSLSLARQADAICFGTLAQRHERSRQTIQTLVAATPPSALRVFDINLRQNFYSREIIGQSLQLANALKLNSDELVTLSEMFGLEGHAENRIQTLARQFNLRAMALTRGESGSLLYSGGAWSDCPGQPVQIVDTVGAGDAFTAVLVMGLLHQMLLPQINAFAGEVARHVCSSSGATPPLPDTIRRRFLARAAAGRFASASEVAPPRNPGEA